MAFTDRSAAGTPAKRSWNRWAAWAAALVLASVAMHGGAVAAAVHCGSRASHHSASTRRPAHGLCSRARAQVAARAPGQARSVAADLGELTPLTASNAPRARPALPAIPLTRISLPTVPRPSPLDDGRTAGDSAGALSLDRSPVTASLRDVRNALEDTMHGGAASMPVLSAPAAWSVLLLGLVGLCVMLPRPTVAKVRSWAMEIPSRIAERRGTPHAPLDRIDPARYAQESGRRWRHGYFVRAAARNRFGGR